MIIPFLPCHLLRIITSYLIVDSVPSYHLDMTSQKGADVSLYVIVSMAVHVPSVRRL
jgi:hypothetical protein